MNYRERRRQIRALARTPIMVSAGVWRDVATWARLRGPHPFHRKRHKRMAGK